MLAVIKPEEELVVTGESNRQSRESTVSSHSPLDDRSIVNRQLSRHGQELPDSDETESLDERTDNSIERFSSSQSVDIRHEDTSMSSNGRSDNREDASEARQSEEKRSEENNYSANRNRPTEKAHLAVCMTAIQKLTAIMVVYRIMTMQPTAI